MFHLRKILTTCLAVFMLFGQGLSTNLADGIGCQCDHSLNDKSCCCCSTQETSNQSNESACTHCQASEIELANPKNDSVCRCGDDSPAPAVPMIPAPERLINLELAYYSQSVIDTVKSVGFDRNSLSLRVPSLRLESLDSYQVAYCIWLT